MPARNTVFLSVALGWAEVLKAKAIFIGAIVAITARLHLAREFYVTVFENEQIICL